jgi:putative Mg2+ transporter-C (MgtC) family protein
MSGISDFVEAVYAGVNSQEVTVWNAMFRLVLSMCLGVAVGAERKRKGQIAGIRTFALIALGATLSMLLSIYVPQEYLGMKSGDPGRIAAQVITGIGFLGGGAMIHMRGSVKGLTTAAGIWLTAIIGLSVGVGMYVCGIFSTLLCLLILTGIDWYERKRMIGQQSRVINLTTKEIVNDIVPLKAVFESNGVHISTFFIEYDYDNLTTEINFVVLTQPQHDFLPMFNVLRSLTPVKSITLSNQVESR